MNFFYFFYIFYSTHLIHFVLIILASQNEHITIECLGYLYQLDSDIDIPSYYLHI